eukprot:TRINITY_DN10569_c0_g1_i4.p2 TRINITY_DN10569_c0_g1~~TRINITY_DN10569_c0_g1_i4.p2  ORF type:complete len:116 (-),score=32.61 TRINITY_DN10569_c0_g1_i4:79-426(-)
MGKGPKVTIGEKLHSSAKSVAGPGPGAYSPNKEAVLERKAAVGIGYGARTGMSFGAKGGAGPGAYSTAELKWGGGFTFGKSLRDNDADTLGPGPAKYEIPSTVPDLPAYEKAKMK